MNITAQGMQRVRHVLILSASALLLAGCGTIGGGDKHAASSTPRTLPPPAAKYMPSGPVQGTTTLWHVRAGLNVAALSCHTTAGIQRDYRGVLERHRTVLKSSYAEAQRHSRGNFDREQTKLYNRFAQRFTNSRSCQAAAQVARESRAMDSAQFVAVAPSLLNRLNRAGS